MVVKISNLIADQPIEMNLRELESCGSSIQAIFQVLSEFLKTFMNYVMNYVRPKKCRFAVCIFLRIYILISYCYQVKMSYIKILCIPWITSCKLHSIKFKPIIWISTLHWITLFLWDLIIPKAWQSFLLFQITRL